MKKILLLLTIIVLNLYSTNLPMQPGCYSIFPNHFQLGYNVFFSSNGYNFSTANYMVRRNTSCSVSKTNYKLFVEKVHVSAHGSTPSHWETKYWVAYKDSGGTNRIWLCSPTQPTCNDNQVYKNGNCYDIGSQGDCNTSRVIASDGSCICSPGSIENSDGTCCAAGNANAIYNVSKVECENTTFVKVDNVHALIHFVWNDCADKCLAENAPPCDYGQIYTEQGYCEDATIDPSECEANGGVLSNVRIIEESTCYVISNDGSTEIYSPCCQKVGDCTRSDGTIIATESIYVSCNTNIEINTTDANNKCTTCTGDTPIATDNGLCTNSTGDIIKSCPNPENKCSNCPDNYPIATDLGWCKNSNGDLLSCPTPNNDINTSDVRRCLTCPEGWNSTNTGMCKHTTVNGIVQYMSCPTDVNNSDTTKLTIQPRPDTNSSFYDTNSSLGNNSGKNAKQKVCPCCPPGYHSMNGSCVISSITGILESIIPCPCITQDVDKNGTDPIDLNGSDGNDTASSLLNGFGKDLEGEVKKAYKSYQIFNSTDCGELQVNESAYLFNQPEAEIKDPLPLFVDIITPYKEIVKNFLIFIVMVIGLFDFFRRS